MWSNWLGLVASIDDSRFRGRVLVVGVVTFVESVVFVGIDWPQHAQLSSSNCLVRFAESPALA